MSSSHCVGHTDIVLFTDWNSSLLLKKSVHMKVCSFYGRNIWQFSSGVKFQLGGLVIKLENVKGLLDP